MRNAGLAIGLTILGGLFAAPPPKGLENEQVKVIQAANVPGQKSRPHVHLVNRVMVHLDRGEMRIVNENGSARDIPFRPGQIRWDPKVGLHTSENTGGTAFRIVEVELKNEPARKADPLAKLPAGFSAEMENEQVRVVRVTPSAVAALGKYKFRVGTLVISLADGETVWQAAGTEGFAAPAKEPAAEWVLVEVK